jgi:cytochrome c oxidase assembly protein subunit 15
LLVFLATLLALAVVVLGAYVRLSDAGLGCPDWPGCYGRITPHHAADEIAQAEATHPQGPVTAAKAWKEMVHRYFAGTLGAIILAIAILAWRRRTTPRQSPALPTALLLVVIFQALLGMWTVTERLMPVVVTSHLLGGMCTLALLSWLALRQVPSAGGDARTPVARGVRGLAALSLVVVAGQIFLGGWVSSNYAALACTDFPLCGGRWVPDMDLAAGFELVRELGMTGQGGLLSGSALIGIHWMHRLGALIVLLVVGACALALMRRAETARWGVLLGVLLLIQVGLGIGNVLLSLPLPVAVGHNAGAALLLLGLVMVNYRLKREGA